MVTHPDTVMVEKVDQKVVEIDVVVLNGSNIGKKKHKKLGEYRGLRERSGRGHGERRQQWSLVIPKLEEGSSRIQHLRSPSRPRAKPLDG